MTGGIFSGLKKKTALPAKVDIVAAAHAYAAVFSSEADKSNTYLQNGHLHKAKAIECYKLVLKLDPRNSVAAKELRALGVSDRELASTIGDSKEEERNIELSPADQGLDASSSSSSAREHSKLAAEQEDGSTPKPVKPLPTIADMSSMPYEASPEGGQSPIIPAIPQRPRRVVEGAPQIKRREWRFWIAASIIVVCLVSGGALMLKDAPFEIAQDAYRGVIAKSQDAYRGVVALSEDAYRGVVAKSQDAYRGVVALSEDAYRGVVALSEDAYRGVVAKSEEAYRGVVAKSEDAYRIAEAKSEDAYRSVVGKIHQLTAPENATVEAAARKDAEEKALAEAAARKSVAEKVAPEAAERRIEEESLEAFEERIWAEAAREVAEAVAQAKTQEAGKRQLAEAARVKAEEAARKAAEGMPKSGVEGKEQGGKAVAEAVAQAKAQEAAKRQLAEDARLKAEEAARKAAEGMPKSGVEGKEQGEKAEAALNLSEQDRKSVQTALNSLDYEIPTVTGYFGSRTRAMITAWQKKQRLPETGYLDAPQLVALQEQARLAKAADETKLDVRQQAERAEAGLNLSEQDRKRVQVALNSLGHEIATATGYFGPRTRAMITAWQKAQGLPETGYLTEVQLATLRQQAAPALTKYDQAQTKPKEGNPGTR